VHPLAPLDELSEALDSHAASITGLTGKGDEIAIAVALRACRMALDLQICEECLELLLGERAVLVRVVITG